MKFIITFSILIAGILSANAQTSNPETNFFEDFSDPSPKNFRNGSTGTKADFKMKTGQVSKKEPSAKILSFKIDPSDSAGAGRGPEIISNKLTHFGTYATRLKVPDVKKVQPNVGRSEERRVGKECRSR